ncbi:MAG: signal peptidase II [Deltaproteobacteria bacterium]|nr:signal peptidase II [Deltaproteobacteria bacterium]
MRPYYLLLALPAVIVIILDQVSKYLVVIFIPLFGTVPVIDGFFNLVHVRNRGMAFGLMNRSEPGVAFYLLVFASIGAIILLLYWSFHLKDRDWKITLGLSLILGGAVGNMIDRLRLKEVIDFLDVSIGTYHWPSFNVADSAITLGAFWLAINLFKAQGAGRKARG